MSKSITRRMPMASQRLGMRKSLNSLMSCGNRKAAPTEQRTRIGTKPRVNCVHAPELPDGGVAIFPGVCDFVRNLTSLQNTAGGHGELDTFGTEALENHSA